MTRPDRATRATDLRRAAARLRLRGQLVPSPADEALGLRRRRERLPTGRVGLACRVAPGGATAVVVRAITGAEATPVHELELDPTGGWVLSRARLPAADGLDVVDAVSGEEVLAELVVVELGGALVAPWDRVAALVRRRSARRRRGTGSAGTTAPAGALPPASRGGRVLARLRRRPGELLAGADRVLRLRRHHMAVIPSASLGGGAVRLASDRRRSPDRTVVLRLRLRSAELMALRVFADDAKHKVQLVHEIPMVPRDQVIDRLLFLPTGSTTIHLVDPLREVPFVGDVEVLELGRLPLVLWLLRSRLPDLADRSAADRLAAVRRVVARARAGGLRELQRTLTRGLARQQADAVRGAGNPLLDPITGDAPPLDPGGDARQRSTEDAEVALREVLRRGAPLRVPRADEPAVSIVVVTWGGARWTVGCLRSIARHAGDDVEVVIVDNASTDQTPELLELVQGATIIRNEENLGFPAACNQGARAARGARLLMLNPDAELLDGSLDAARSALDETGADVVGGPVVSLDGRLQEAGCILWSDGSCEGFGRGFSISREEFQYRRAVDFVSGVFLLVERATWDRLGGFDEVYTPAYYEDADLCARVWATGGQVVYEPGAVVRHVEHGVVGTDGRARELMERNRRTFVERNGEVLAGRLAPSRDNRLVAACARHDQPKVLVLDDRVPFDDEGSGAPRMAAMVRALVDAGAQVTFYAKLLPSGGHRSPHDVLPIEVEAIVGRGIDRFATFLEERRRMYDLLVISRPHNLRDLRDELAEHPDLLDGTYLAYDAEALEVLRAVGEAEVSGEPLSPAAIEEAIAREVALTRDADCVIAVSPGEAAAFAANGAADPLVVSHSVVAADGPGRDERSGLLFVGNLRLPSLPNVDGLVWFVQEVLPLLRDRLAEAGRPTVALRAVGRTSRATRELLAAEGVELVGAVADLAPAYRRAAVFVAPTRVGAGIPLKVIDAAANGVPVVATELLARQLDWPDAALTVAPVEPEAFAAAVEALLLDDVRWSAQRAAASDVVARRHSQQALQATMAELLARAVARRR